MDTAHPRVPCCGPSALIYGTSMLTSSCFHSVFYMDSVIHEIQNPHLASERSVPLDLRCRILPVGLVVTLEATAASNTVTSLVISDGKQVMIMLLSLWIRSETWKDVII